MSLLQTVSLYAPQRHNMTLKPKNVLNQAIVFLFCETVELKKYIDCYDDNSSSRLVPNKVIFYGYIKYHI